MQITRIEFVHSNHIVHRDIKPANFVMSIPTGAPCTCSPSSAPASPAASTTSLVSEPPKASPPCTAHPLVNIIDFGLAKKYRDPVSMFHIPFSRHPHGLHGVGTSLFASINTHLGLESARRDDLESLAYMLIYFLRGTLPWRKLRAPSSLPSSVLQQISDTEERHGAEERYNPVTATWDLIRDSKREHEATLTDGLPEEFDILYTYARNLEFDDLPDYEGLRRCFRGLADRLGVEYDGVFDWTLDGPSGSDGTVDDAGTKGKAKGKPARKSGGGGSVGKAGSLHMRTKRGRTCLACEARAQARLAEAATAGAAGDRERRK
jgi:casein kinase I family protein HRR25